MAEDWWDACTGVIPKRPIFINWREFSLGDEKNMASLLEMEIMAGNW